METSLVLSALTFSPALLASSSSPASDGTNAARGSAAYGSMSPNPQKGASSASAARFGANRSHQLQVAMQSDDNCTADKFDDAEVRANDGEKLGKIRDFLVDPSDGTIRYAVVSSGGWAGIGDTLHLVPFTALKSANRDSADNTAFTVALTKTKWQALPKLAEDKFEEGRVKLTQQEDQQIAQTFSTEASRADANTELLRASKIRGLDVTAQSQDIGSIEGVVIQPGKADGFALLDPDNDFVGGSQKYLVPISDLQLTGNGSAHTSLTKQDFRSAAQSSQATAINDHENSGSSAKTTTATTDDSYAANATSGSNPPVAANGEASSEAKSATSSKNDSATAANTSASAANTGSVRVEMPTPTGFSSADQNPTTSQKLIDGAQAIRRALDRDNTLSRQDVTIVPENGKITLKGTVASDDMKAKIEDVANTAGAPNVVISNLQVQQK